MDRGVSEGGSCLRAHAPRAFILIRQSNYPLTAPHSYSALDTYFTGEMRSSVLLH